MNRFGEDAPTTTSVTLRLRRIGARAAVATVLVAAAAAGTAGTASAATTAPAEYWAAIAVGPDSGSAGYATDYPTADAAAQAALDQCGADDCQSAVEVTNGCASIAQASDYSMGWGWGASRADSDAVAINSTPGSGASVFGWACTTGHQ